jgi:hypothetical protein
MTTYSYTMALIAVDRLTQEIQTSSIVTALDHINALGSAVDTFFKADLSATDKTTLDAVVAAHTGVPLPSNQVQNVSVQSTPLPSPFAAKTVGAKKLYKRVSGVKQGVLVGDNTILFTIPYAWAKLTGLELIAGENLDTACLYILDSTTGTYTGVPNYQLNQFGFTVNVSKDYYAHRSEFDADLYINMQIKVVYNSLTPKNVGINFILNEVK